MLPKILWRVLRLLLITAYQLHSTVTAQYLQSPCPDIFTYQVDPSTRQIFGYIELNNVRVGQVALLKVDLSIATQLPSSNVGSITLVKSREATFNDIVRGEPAQYRVNFPLQNILPTVLAISLNGQTICTGYKAQGRLVTTINLEHTLYAQYQTPNGSPFQHQNGFDYETGPSYQPQPQPPQQNVFQYQPQRPFSQPQPTRPPQIIYQQQTNPPPVLQTRPPTTQLQVVRPTVPASRPQSAPSGSVPCGKPSTRLLNRLSINGKDTQKGQFPWAAPLFDRVQPSQPKFFCGSTIINRKHLITAAHCVSDVSGFLKPERILAVPGMFNIENFLEDSAHIAEVSAVIVHDEYVQDDDQNDADLAVIRLKEVLVYTDYIIPVCLWQQSNDIRDIIGQAGFVSGWGFVATGPVSLPTYITADVVEPDQCSRSLSRVFSKSARIFCGDGNGAVPCNGDSGSGFVMKVGNQHFLRGVVSKGQVDENLKCDTKKYAIYTDIAPFRFWLKMVLN